MKYIYLVLMLIAFSGCSYKNDDLNKKKSLVYDLVNLPQSVEYYSSNIDINKYDNVDLNNFINSYFKPWNIFKPKDTLSQIQWPFKSYKYGNSYGENFQLLDKNFFNSMYYNANYTNYLTLNKKAITLKYINIRSFPTNRPLLRDPSLAGEGFPFDYLQNSSLQANKPIFVSHYSLDKEWVHIFSSFAYGWVKADEIVFLTKKDTDKIQSKQQITLIKEDIPIYSLSGTFLFKSKVGTILPLLEEHKDFFIVSIVSAYKKNEPLFVKAKVYKKNSVLSTLTFNTKNINKIINEVSKSNYGWGGMYEQRDCSSTIRDIFIPFGKWLPRNSFQQGKVDLVINLNGLSDEEKINTIKNKAVAFKTLFYKKGHVMLYVGTYNNEVVIFHNTWGIKTIKNGVAGRVVIGKSIFSSLKLGSHQKDYDKSSELLKNLKSMNILNI